jgi:hypothetical protein
MERLKLGRTGAIKLYVIAIFFAMLCSLGFLINCPQQPFSGVTYGQKENKTIYGVPDLDLPCNSKCRCNNEYEPVCGANQVEVSETKTLF